MLQYTVLCTLVAVQRILCLYKAVVVVHTVKVYVSSRYSNTRIVIDETSLLRCQDFKSLLVYPAPYQGKHFILF